MTVHEILQKFEKDYPGKNIVCLPQDNPTEIICEVDPSSDHPDFNRAVAAIKKSVPHYHDHAEETYKVLQGELDLYVDGKHIKLSEGAEYVIPAKSIHYAKGEFTIIQVDSTPGWTPGDHFLAEN